MGTGRLTSWTVGGLPGGSILLVALAMVLLTGTVQLSSARAAHFTDRPAGAIEARRDACSEICAAFCSGPVLLLLLALLLYAINTARILLERRHGHPTREPLVPPAPGSTIHPNTRCSSRPRRLQLATGRSGSRQTATRTCAIAFLAVESPQAVRLEQATFEGTGTAAFAAPSRAHTPRSCRRGSCPRACCSAAPAHFVGIAKTGAEDHARRPRGPPSAARDLGLARHEYARRSHATWSVLRADICPLPPPQTRTCSARRQCRCTSR